MGIFRKKQESGTTDVETLAAEMAVVSAVVAAYPSNDATIHFGAPTRCPRCTNFGFVDDVDRQAGICENSCMSCGESWTLSRRAIRAERAMRGESVELHKSMNPEMPSWMSGEAEEPDVEEVASTLPPPALTAQAKVVSTHEAGPEPYVPASQRAPDPRLPKWARDGGTEDEPVIAANDQLPPEARFEPPPRPRRQPTFANDQLPPEARFEEPPAPRREPEPAPVAEPVLEELIRPKRKVYETTFPEPSPPAPAAEPIQPAVAHQSPRPEPAIPRPVTPEPAIDAAPPPEPGESAAAKRPMIDWSGSSPAATPPPTEAAPTPPAPEPAPTSSAPAPTTPEAVAPEQVAPASVVPAPTASPSAPPPADPMPAPTAPESTPTPAAAAAIGPLRVLVVEDNVFDYMFLETLVEPLPPGEIELVHATTLAEGYRMVEEGFDLTLLDLGLPDSAGIATVLEWQHNTDSATPIIVTSGDNTPDLVQQARGLGVAHFLQKEHLNALAETEAGAQRFLKLLEATAKKRRATQPNRSVPS